jgi:hypothetical protein
LKPIKQLRASRIAHLPLVVGHCCNRQPAPAEHPGCFEIV